MFSLSNKTGEQAEVSAEKYLRQQGLRLEAKNYTCRFGEIDLIMVDQETLVFVEVRLRNNSRFGGAAVTVDHRKQSKLIRSAEYYLQRRKGALPVCRFDVIAFDSGNQVNWIKNAFETSH